ncbi:cytochrome c [Lysobacter sp. 5GHs7-4]|uniref:c-type cytochrome n=1 Tax=Lysobacter sp. 5GHs7-4 TaxID=2904253 RepID=UPI001E33C55A|nr:cytochrome c [Lysobacter sp. 5GHs7-4]UHQ21429.1 cytochrome c [Lysobacter sp. 5GHs7-4]
MGAAAAAGGLIWSGAYDVSADAPHTRPVYAVLETARKRSVAVRAQELQVPSDLSSPERIRQGAGNYDAMCAGCHLAPGMDSTELSRGLYPAPPELSKAAIDPRHAFWTIKHGIKASGMPAWGGSMDDEYIWNMTALLQALPSLDEARYRALVAESGGHSHGGGETMAEGADDHHDATPHGHGDGGDHGQAAHAAGVGDERPQKPANAAGAQAAMPAAHRHADGKAHAAHGSAEAAKPAATAPAATVKPAAPTTPKATPTSPPKSTQEHDAHEHSH